MENKEEKKSINRKTAVVTGVNSMLGRSIMEMLIDKEYFVIGTVRNIDENQDLLENKNLELYNLDLTSESSIDLFLATVTTIYSNIQAIINNAAHVLAGPLESLELKQIRYQMEVNFFGNILLTKKLIPYFKEKKRGKFVFISSLAGLTTFPMFSMYHASKWALEGFAESLYYELAPLNIKVKLIEPGGIKSNDYKLDVEIADNVGEEYKKTLNKVFQTDWFPSFSNPQEIAGIIFKAIEDEEDRLRYLAGESCELLVKERYANFENEKYLTDINKRLNSANEY